MQKTKLIYFLILLIVLIFVQGLFFNLIIMNGLKENGDVFSSYLSNFLNNENFIVSKLDQNFNDLNLNQSFLGILNEGPNDYIQGIYYPVNTLKYVKKVNDGYLLYEIPGNLIQPLGIKNKIYVIAVNNKIVFSNKSSLIGSDLSKTKLFSASFKTKQGFIVVVGIDILTLIFENFIILIPLILLFLIFYYILKKQFVKYEKLVSSINVISKKLEEANKTLQKNGTINCYEFEINSPELLVLKEQLEKFVNNFLIVLEKQKEISKKHEKVSEELKLTHEALINKNFQLISALAETVEIKDSVTGNHSKKVVDLAVEIAKILGIYDEEEIEAIMYGAILHDIGKIGIPESILNKPSKLTPEEFEIMKKHTIFGEKIVKSIPGWDLVADIIRHHHENYDGSGYPDGLSGDEISLRAQIVSIADVFTALTEDRPYRKALSVDEAIEIIRDMVGTKFSEEIFNAFLKALDSLLYYVDKNELL